MNNKRGFTLVELMVVVVVVSILAAIAYPSYSDSVRKGRRSDGKAALLSAVQTLERFYTESNTYSGAPLTATSSERFYQLTFDTAPTSATVCGATSATNAVATNFRICATPVGAQASDSCGVLSLSSTGVKLPITSGCW